MNIAEKSKKLLGYSLIIKTEDKKSWLESLPKMTENQIQVLYDVLTEEVRTWKKEGISIVPDLALEQQLLPEEKHGASLNSLKKILETGPAPASMPHIPVPSPNIESKTEFGKELKREVMTPELAAPGEDVPEQKPAEDENEPEIDWAALETKTEMPGNNHAWMLSNKVTVPKSNLGVVKPKPMGVPKIRNRVAKHGLPDLESIKSIDDLQKIEPAHLRQASLPDQIDFIKKAISQLAHENDMLPVSVIPVFEQSPLYQTYLKAGAMLIEKNTGEDKIVLDEIMGELENAGMDSLSQQEFEAVADLKQALEAMAGI